MVLKNFKYIAYNADKKIIKGRIEALNRQVCTKFLVAKNYEVIQIKEYTSLIARLDKITLGKVMTPKALVFFLKQLGALLKAGIKLMTAIELLALQQENRQLRRLYFEIYQQIYNGYSFSRTIGAKKNEFPELLVQMSEVGELSGDLPETILRMASYYENQLKIVTQIKSAIRMPIIYLVAAILISVGMLIFVFPNITNLFEVFGNAQLPPITQFFINAGSFMEQYALLMLFMGIAISFTGYILNKHVSVFHEGVTKFILRVPIFGQLIQMNNQVLIANALSQMMSNGINSIDALYTTEQIVSNVVYKALMKKTVSYMEDGKPFSKSFEESPYIDTIMARMIQTGEQSGDIPRLMENLSIYYKGVAEVRVEQIKNALEPLLLIIVYTIVGVMLLALMLPMLTLGTQL